MDRIEESFQKSMQQFKAKNLVLETHDDGLVQVKHISGRTFASGYMERDKIPGWLEDNMDRIIETVKASGLLTPCVHKIEFQNGSILKSEFVEVENQGRGNSPIPDQELPHSDSIFTLHMITGYPEEKILDFLKLSGLSFDKAKIKLKDFEKLGLDLSTVNRLLILGDLRYEKTDI